MLRRMLQAMAGNPAIVSTLAWLGNRSGLTRRFIAGESFEEAVPAIQELSAAGLETTLDLLGEGVSQRSDAEAAAAAYTRLLRRIDGSKIHAGISVKPTQLGLAIDRELCCQNLTEILVTARELNNFVRIDMEGSEHTQSTLDLFRQCWERFGRHVGIVVQAYLYRTEEDVKALSNLGCNIRLCKGAYMEPTEIAFPRKRDVDRNFCRLVEIMLAGEGYSAIATHDEKMISFARRIIAEKNIPDSKYEFQMLYGIRRERQYRLCREGDKVRIYVPFGTQWAPYFIRRLAERPANLLFVIRSIFRK